jgi:hypothetical protein
VGASKCSKASRTTTTTASPCLPSTPPPRPLPRPTPPPWPRTRPPLRRRRWPASRTSGPGAAAEHVPVALRGPARRGHHPRALQGRRPN